MALPSNFFSHARPNSDAILVCNDSFDYDTMPVINNNLGVNAKLCAKHTPERLDTMHHLQIHLAALLLDSVVFIVISHDCHCLC